METIKVYHEELFLMGLAYYYGMTVREFANLIGDDSDKLARFYFDYKYNHN